MFAQLANTILHGVRIFDEPGKTACGLYIGSAGNGNTICETATQLFRKN